VIGEARRYLEALETERDRQRSLGSGHHTATAQSELPLFAAAAAAPGPAPADEDLRAALRAIDPDELSPKAALEALYSLRRLLEESK